MMRLFAVVAVLGALTVVGCGTDDGSNITNPSGKQASGSALARADARLSTMGLDDPLIVAGARAYQDWARQQTHLVRTQAQAFTAAVRSGDVERAKAAYAPSRRAWEAMEPIASFVPEIDGVIDSQVDDFENDEDPAWNGWHRLERQLWLQGTIDDTARRLASVLDDDLATLEAGVAKLRIKPAMVASGALDLVDHVATATITGGEDRYSHTDLSDFAANIGGAQQAYQALRPAFVETDTAGATSIDRLFRKLGGDLAPYRKDVGYKEFGALTVADRHRMKAALARLSHELAAMNATLGLS
jgi:iron uptake system component EfeO